MPKKVLTDRTLKALKSSSTGKPFDVMDAVVPGLGVRVLAGGRRTFILLRRFPGSRNPARRALGEYGALSLDEARSKARHWLELIRKGIDPQEDEDRLRLAQQRRRENSFRSVAEEFFRLAVIGPDPEKPKQRKGTETKRDIEREFIARWGGRPITDITPHDVIAVIDETVVRGSPYQAHNLLGHVRRLFNWAIARQVYGLERSPCDRMRPRDVIGAKASRTRVLGDTEVRALWKAAASLSYPYGPLFQLLALTGQRKSEVAKACWSEFDLEKKLWVIPAERMKMGSPHVVPLSDDAILLLGGLPRFKSGDHLFSTTFGEKAVNGFSKAKANLDKAMLLELRKDIKDKKAPEKILLPPFVIHDIRRTVRTAMSAFPISSDVAELVIAHARHGLRKVYDQYAYLDEKRLALELWSSKLRSIIEPKSTNIIPKAVRG